MASRKCVCMEKKVFILGLPGSGKSTAARYIECLAKSNGWVPVRFNDYDILYEMFRRQSDGSVEPVSSEELVKFKGQQKELMETLEK